MEESDAEAYAFLNNQEQPVGGDIVEALNAITSHLQSGRSATNTLMR